MAHTVILGAGIGGLPMTFEPYIGHLGLNGVGDSKSMMESIFRDKSVRWICNAKVTKVEAGLMHVTEHDEDGKPKKEHATWNAVCLADFGDRGAAFVALPQIPPRNVSWFSEGYWVHLAKIAFEKYFMRKMKKGTSEPIYERVVMKAMGIMKLKDH